ncbi:MAG: PIG-L family deacetylase [Candidatus Thermoplasmatota archaeon]|jgi:LmbE family N-acetylglucosaminyl deacetylase|nr:PIG-L family deacetylase [Candidatus Thermoplasmatota archaeon]MCL5681272.1 PIG-L family deacetylase [Candidatus Thermoplasmatota archaeon]
MEFSSYLRSLELDDTKLATLSASSRILAISPHPDDSELIAGAFLSQRVHSGAHVKLILVSDGRKGAKDMEEEKVAEIRMGEQKEAIKALGIREMEFLGFKDTEVPSPSVLRDTLLEKMRKFQPDLVVTVDPFLEMEVHPDHISTGMAVLQSVLFFEFPNIGKGIPNSSAPAVALGGTNRPNVIFNCMSFDTYKRRALECHASQFNEDAIDLITSLGELVGSRIGSKCGEPFRVLYQHELHVNILGGMQPW